MFCWYVNPDGAAWNLANVEALWIWGGDEIVARFGVTPYGDSEGNVPTIYKGPTTAATKREFTKILRLVGATPPQRKPSEGTS